MRRGNNVFVRNLSVKHCEALRHGQTKHTFITRCVVQKACTFALKRHKHDSVEQDDAQSYPSKEGIKLVQNPKQHGNESKTNSCQPVVVRPSKKDTHDEGGMGGFIAQVSLHKERRLMLVAYARETQRVGEEGGETHTHGRTDGRTQRERETRTRTEKEKKESEQASKSEQEKEARRTKKDLIHHIAKFHAFPWVRSLADKERLNGFATNQGTTGAMIAITAIAEKTKLAIQQIISVRSRRLQSSRSLVHLRAICTVAFVPVAFPLSVTAFAESGAAAAQPSLEGPFNNASAAMACETMTASM